MPAHEARLEAELLLAHALGMDRYGLYTKDVSHILDKDRLDYFWSLVRRREKGESTAYILGKKEFWSLVFRVGKGCLVPRPETELLVEQAVDFLKTRTLHWPVTILDLGTGSGCIAVALAKELSENTSIPFNVVAADISSKAMEYARDNILYHGLEEKVHLVRGHWLDPFKPGAFHLIVTNPPYIPQCEYDALPKEVLCEPKGALVGGEDGLSFIRETIIKGPTLLKKGGGILMEIGVGQAPRVLRLLMDGAMNFHKVTVVRDLAGIERVVRLEV